MATNAQSRGGSFRRREPAPTDSLPIQDEVQTSVATHPAGTKTWFPAENQKNPVTAGKFPFSQPVFQRSLDSRSNRRDADLRPSRDRPWVWTRIQRQQDRPSDIRLRLGFPKGNDATPRPWRRLYR